MKLNFDTYKDKVRACWVGKNIGGTMGAPYEGKRQVLDVKGFVTKPGEVLPNDDLDLQLVWLFAVEKIGPWAINANTLGEFWLSYITPFWNEYGIGKLNMQRGLLPSMSGDYDNSWKHSNGAWIRTEIWASLCPGTPEAAAKYAIEDARVDHGAGEGTYAAAFVAAMQSAAFVVSDLRKCIEIGLAAIPADCRTAKSIRLVINSYDGGKSWLDTRNAVLKLNQDIGNGWFEAPSNVSYTILGLLYGEGDFKKSMIIAINCGDDTDCTAATVGATLGILYGSEGIPADWQEYIGDEIVTISVAKGDCCRHVPATCTELTERVVRLTAATLLANQSAIELTAAESLIPETVVEQLLIGMKKPMELIYRYHAPYTFHMEFTFLQAHVTVEEGPDIAPGQSKKICLRLRNNCPVYDGMPHNLSLRWMLPEGFTVSGKTTLQLPAMNPHTNGTTTLEAIVTAGEHVEPENRIVLEIVNKNRFTPIYIPVLLLG